MTETLTPQRERVYTTVDKSEWCDGPWQDEPDKIQWKDAATGLPCLVKRGPMGVWCGYVGVPPGHPAYGQDYNNVRVPGGDEDGWPDVHGGLTYADHCAEGPEESSICHVPEPGEPDHVWWLGFDCGHSGDISPRMEADRRKRYEETGDPLWAPDRYSPWPESYKTLDYARREVTKLASQLAAASSARTKEEA
jgi:hypothetical protein